MTTEQTKTEVGSHFVSNYPPYSQWTADQLPEVRAALDAPPTDVSSTDGPLGLYLHIPFCRKRCKFCYFRVYTGKNADEVKRYIAALKREIELISRLPVVGQRPIRLVYFGGGTPSFLGQRQLAALFDQIRQNLDWSHVEEVTFECEPGTLSEPKIRTLRDLGVTRLSLGVENFNDAILEENGRAHLSAEIYDAWQWIQASRFPNVNIDLIAGMVGETWDTWKETVRHTLELSAQSVTIYQMEFPFNTVYSQDILDNKIASPVADWPTKRAWVDYAYDQLEAAGYCIGSVCTKSRGADEIRFGYRDHLFEGGDLLASGVASFGHISGVHYQNQTEWNEYLTALEQGELPLRRGMRLTDHQRMIRETVLLLKRGWLDAGYFRTKFGVDIRQEWASVWRQYEQDGLLNLDGQRITLTRKGLLQVDALLPAFFEPEHQDVRYT